MSPAILTQYGLGMAVAIFLAAGGFTSARYRAGSVPSIPFQAVGGGEVFLELSVDQRGVVQDVKTLRATPPFTDAMTDAVRAWQFHPAEETTEAEGKRVEARTQPVESKVLVAGLFRPPTINTPTIGERPRDVASASSETPVPLTTVLPPYSPVARDPGVLLVEVRVDARGRVVEATAIRSAPPFDQAGLDAVRQWTFRPARVRGTTVSAFAYVVFGFRPPLTTSER